MYPLTNQHSVFNLEDYKFFFSGKIKHCDGKIFMSDIFNGVYSRGSDNPQLPEVLNMPYSVKASTRYREQIRHL